DARGKLLAWGSIVVAYLVVLEESLPGVLESTTNRERLVRIAISLTAIMPLGFELGFAFPTGMRLVEEVDRQPAPWFWGINGAPACRHDRTSRAQSAVDAPAVLLIILPVAGHWLP